MAQTTVRAAALPAVHICAARAVARCLSVLNQLFILNMSKLANSVGGEY